MGNCFKKKRENTTPLLNKFTSSFDEDFSQYFDMIRLKVSKFYKENQNNQFNISISLDKREFNQSIVPKRFNLNPSERFVYWKDYLLEFLEKSSTENCTWINELLSKIENEIFLKENKWLSLFFWQEFELRTRPPNILNSKEEEFDQTGEEDNINQIAEKIRLNSNLSERFHAGGKGDSSIQEGENPQQIYREYRKKVKSYIQIFNQHISNVEHPINIIVHFFADSFSRYLKNVIDEINDFKIGNINSINDKSSSILDINTNEHLTNIKLNKTSNYNWDNIIEESIDYKQQPTKIIPIKQNKIRETYSHFLSERYSKVVKYLQKFILKLQTSLRLMYAKTINYQCFIEEKDEFINLICNLIFRTGKLYDLIYELFEITHKSEIEELKNKLLLFTNINPEDLSIKPQFCLNRKTVELQQNLIKKNKIGKQ